jgi:hypothetical protein
MAGRAKFRLVREVEPAAAEGPGPGHNGQDDPGRVSMPHSADVEENA